jgi:cob(I)alamin adenosyltransferase
MKQERLTIMAKKSNIYTGGGDKGMTSLVGGLRVPKTHLRLEAYGAIDELNAFLGLLIAEIKEEDDVWRILRFIQDRLFTVGGYLATDGSGQTKAKTESIAERDILKVEEAINRIDEDLPRLHTFVIPGGCPSSALAHVCRTVCRRAERAICRLAEKENVDGNVSVFINRISDLLFVIARRENLLRKGEEIFLDNKIEW